MSSNVTWFAFPKDAHTNKVISNFIGLGTEEDASQFLCEDGEERGMWRTNWQNIKRLWDSRKDLSLKMEIFNQKGRGKIRNVTLIFTDNFRKGKDLIKRLQSQKKLF